MKTKNGILDKVPELTRVSSKGQVVIPQEIRKDMRIKEGTVFAVNVAKQDLLILKKIDSSILADDIATAKEVENAWKEIEKGEYNEYEFDEFIDKLEKM